MALTLKRRVFPRPQPDRDGLSSAQGARTQSHGANYRGPLSTHQVVDSNPPSSSMHGIFQARRLCSTLTGKYFRRIWSKTSRRAPCRDAASQRVGRDWRALGRAQAFEAVGGLLQLRIESTDAEPCQSAFIQLTMRVCSSTRLSRLQLAHFRRLRSTNNRAALALLFASGLPREGAD